MAKISQDSTYIIIESSSRISYVPKTEATVMVDGRGLSITSSRSNFRFLSSNIEDENDSPVADIKTYIKSVFSKSTGTVAVDPAPK